MKPKRDVTEREYFLELFTVTHAALILACDHDQHKVRAYIGRATDEAFERGMISLPVLQYLDKWASYKVAIAKEKK